MVRSKPLERAVTNNDMIQKPVSCVVRNLIAAVQLQETGHDMFAAIADLDGCGPIHSAPVCVQRVLPECGRGQDDEKGGTRLARGIEAPTRWQRRMLFGM